MSGRRSGELRTWAIILGVALLALGLWRFAMVIEAVGLPFPRADHLAFALTVTFGAVVLVGTALRLERVSPRAIGLVSPLAGLGQGVAWYAIPAGLGLAVAVVAGWAEIGLLTPAGEALLKLVALTALVFLAEALPEELIFRGLIQTRLATRMGPWSAILLQAALFTLFAWLIGAATGPMDLGFIAGFGVALGVLRAATGTLWAPIGFHLVFMTFQQSWNADWDLLRLTLEPTLRMILLVNIPFSVVIALLFSRVARSRPAAS